MCVLLRHHCLLVPKQRFPSQCSVCLPQCAISWKRLADQLVCSHKRCQQVMTALLFLVSPEISGFYFDMVTKLKKRSRRTTWPWETLENVHAIPFSHLSRNVPLGDPMIIETIAGIAGDPCDTLLALPLIHHHHLLHLFLLVGSRRVSGDGGRNGFELKLC